MPPIEPLELIWDALLSREPKQITAAFQSLDPDNRRRAVEHLRRMVTEEGWHTEQRRSARAALDTIEPPGE